MMQGASAQHIRLILQSCNTAVNTTTGPQLPLVHFPRLRLPGPTLETGLPPQRLRRHLLPFKPKNMTDDIFLAQIRGHKVLGPNAALSLGQSYKDFYIKT
jgi:hypothetical protein